MAWIETPKRLKNSERSALTKKAILEATIDTLAELGYSNTSTSEIVKRANVSRGAQVHHFPTKSELVIAALRYLFESRTEEFVRKFEEFGDGRVSFNKAIEILWTLFSGNGLRAAHALVAQALFDERLRVVVIEVLSDFDKNVEAVFSKLYPEFSSLPFSKITLSMTFAVLEAGAIYREIGMEEKSNEIVSALKLSASFWEHLIGNQ